MYYHAISKAVILKVSGAHSLRYLNSRLTNDFNSLSYGRGFYAAALNASGRTEALFAAYRLLDGALLISDGGEPEGIKTSFCRYIVADRVEVAELSKSFNLFHVSASFDAHKELAKLYDITPGENLLLQEEFVFLEGKSGSLLASRKRGMKMGLDYLIPAAESDSFCSHLARLGICIINEEQIALNRLQAGIPSFPLELNEKNIFSDMPFIKAISSNKGCYTGQEVIEKIASRGKSPRILVRLKIEGDTVSDLNVYEAGGLIGEITSMAFDKSSNSILCFALIKNQEGLTDRQLTVDTRGAKILDLPKE